jgi:hypothetical protein
MQKFIFLRKMVRQEKDKKSVAFILLFQMKNQVFHMSCKNDQTLVLLSYRKDKLEAKVQ